MEENMLIVGLILFFVLVGGMTAFYFSLKKANITKKMSGSFMKTMIVTGIFSIFIICVGVLTLSVNKAHAQEKSSQTQTQEVKPPANNSSSAGLGFIAAALAVGLGSLGAGIAVGMSGAAAVGAISENPKIFGNAIVFVAMAEGIAIYGVVIAILILARI
jgi:V/A-type H+-transporting ATPase subunit K